MEYILGMNLTHILRCLFVAVVAKAALTFTICYSNVIAVEDTEVNISMAWYMGWGIRWNVAGCPMQMFCCGCFNWQQSGKMVRWFLRNWSVENLRKWRETVNLAWLAHQPCLLHYTLLCKPNTSRQSYKVVYLLDKTQKTSFVTEELFRKCSGGISPPAVERICRGHWGLFWWINIMLWHEARTSVSRKWMHSKSSWAKYSM